MSHEALNMGHRYPIPFLGGVPAQREIPVEEQRQADTLPSGEAPLANTTSLLDARRAIILAANRGPLFRDPRRRPPPDSQTPGTTEPPPPPDDGPLAVIGPRLGPRSPLGSSAGVRV